MKKTISIFSLVILLLSTFLPSFTFAVDDIDVLTGLLQDAINEEDAKLKSNDATDIQLTESNVINTLQTDQQEDSYTITYDLNGGYWTEDGTNTSKTISYNKNDIWHTERRTPSKGDTCTESSVINKKCMFAGRYYTGLETRFTGYINGNITVYAKRLPFEERTVVLNDSTTIKIMDRNIGAESNVRTNEKARGYLFQWGNNYGFDAGTPGTPFPNGEKFTGEKVELGNYISNYSRSIIGTGNGWFIYNKSMDNLRGGESENEQDSIRQGPCPKGYHVPSYKENQAMHRILGFSDTSFLNNLNLPPTYRYDFTNNILKTEDNKYGYYWSSVKNLYGYEGEYNYLNTTNNNKNVNLAYNKPSNYLFAIRCFADNIHKKINLIKNGGTTTWDVDHTNRRRESSGLPKPTRINSKFIGWYTTSNFTPGTEVTTATIETDEEEVNLYAKYECNAPLTENEDGTGCSDRFNVEYNPNGGAFPGMEINEIKNYIYQYDGENLIPIYNIQIPNRTSDNTNQQSGWMFAGWYTKSGDINNPFNADWGEEFIPGKTIVSTVYAKWLPFNDLKIKLGNTEFTIMDRNLGAEDVAEGKYYGSNNGHEENNKLGYYYQWGNNYGFKNIENTYPSNSGTDLITNPDNTEKPRGPNNYYFSNKYIKTSQKRDVEKNKNLWGGEFPINTDTDRQGPCPKGYHIPDTEERASVRAAINNVKSQECVGELSGLGKCISAKLKLPMAGNRNYYNAKINYQGAAGYYWSSSPYRYEQETSERNYAYGIVNNSTQIVGGETDRTYGYSIRCFKNSELKTLTINPENGEELKTEKYRWWENIGTYIPNITKQGHVFIGWYYDLNDENKINYYSKLLEDKEIYAKWSKLPRFTFNLNGGKINGSSATIELKAETDNEKTEMSIGNVSEPKKYVITYTGAKIINLQIKNRSRYATNLTKIYSYNRINNDNTDDYYAKIEQECGAEWNGCKKDYIYNIPSDTVTIETYGTQSGPSDSFMIEAIGIWFNELGEEPKKSGNEFMGWYESGTNIEYNLTNTPLTKDRIFNAKWKALEEKAQETTTKSVVYTNGTTVTIGDDVQEENINNSSLIYLVSKEVETEEVKTEEEKITVQESEIQVTSDKTVEYQGGLEVYLEKTENVWTENETTERIEGTAKFSSPVAVKIPIYSNAETVKVQVKHEGEEFGYKGLTLNPVNECNNGEAVNDKYNGENVKVKNNNGDKYALIYTCSASTFVAYTENIKPVISQPSAGGGRTITTIKQETKIIEQEHNSADIVEPETTQTSSETVKAPAIEEQVKKIEGRSLTRGEVAIMTSILLEVYPQLVEGKQELDDVTNACSNYADEQNFTKDEKKAITRLCKLSIMGIHNDTNEPLEEFLVNSKSTNDEFSKVINRSIATYNEKDLTTIKDALKKLEGDEENVVFGTVYDMFMGIKNIFS